MDNTDVNLSAPSVDAGVESSTTQNNDTVANSSEGDELEKALSEVFSESAEESENTKEEQGQEKEDDADQSKSRGEERKERLNQEIRDSVAELNRLKSEISQYQELQLPTVEELTNSIMSLDENISEADAAIEARMRLIEAQNSRKAEIETIAETRYEQILATENAKLAYPELFDSSNPDFNPDLANGILEMYEDVAHVKRGNDGEVISTTVRLQPFLESIGQIYQLGVMQGEKASNARKTNTKSKQTNVSYNPYPRSNSTVKGEQTEEDFVRSVLNI